MSVEDTMSQQDHETLLKAKYTVRG